MPAMPLVLLACLIKLWTMSPPGLSFRCDNGVVEFISAAPLERIEACSAKLRGIIDGNQYNFAWTIPMRSFEGFNSSLQREHFFENYVESDRFPVASFNGKIIEKIDFRADGSYTVRAKGKLFLHGVEQERIIKSTVRVKGSKLEVSSDFTIQLGDHNIAIPKIVSQKISPEIKVKVSATLFRSE